MGKYVANQIEESTGLDSRSIVLGHVQRGGTPSAFDRVLATRFGFYAFELLMSGKFGELVVEQQGQISSVPIVEVAGKVRTVPQDYRLVRAARAIGTSFGD